MPKPECGWISTLSAPQSPLMLCGHRQVKFAVLGAGFSGLACARRLAELFPDDTVAMLESARVGDGNSGRNSGFLLDTAFYSDDTPAVHRARNRLQKAGLAELSRVVMMHAIECDWHPWGNLYGALTEAEEFHLNARVVPYKTAGETLEDLSAADMKRVTGSPKYRRGVFHRGSVLVQPAALVRGLARTLPANVTLFELSPALSIAPQGAGYRIETPSGHLDAEQVFICVNGSIPTFGYGTDRLVKVATFAAMSRPQSGDGNSLGGGNPFGLLPSFSGGPTLRKTKDNRLIVRDSYIFAPTETVCPEATAHFVQKAQRAVKLRWPDHDAIDFEYAWNGAMVLTRNSGQFFGKMADGVFLTACCNGAGNTLGTASGKLLAEFAAGLKPALLEAQRAIPTPSWVPPNFILRHFVGRQISAMQKRQREVYA